MVDRLATLDMSRKEGAAVRLSGGAGLHVTHAKSILILIHTAVLPQQTLAENWGGALPPLEPLFGEGELGPHLTQSRLGRALPPYQVES